MSLLADTAAAVADALNGHDFGEPLTAVRGYLPEYKLADLDRLHVTVVPGNMEETPLDRSATLLSPQVQVAVQRRMDPVDVAAGDALMDLAENIAGALRGRRLSLADGSTAEWESAEWSTPYAPEELKSRRLFVAVLTLRYKVVQ